MFYTDPRIKVRVNSTSMRNGRLRNVNMFQYLKWRTTRVVYFGTSRVFSFAPFVLFPWQRQIAKSSPCDYDPGCAAYKRPPLHHACPLATLVHEWLRWLSNPPINRRTTVTCINSHSVAFSFTSSPAEPSPSALLEPIYQSCHEGS